jgi:hypothetical protein
MKWLKMKVSAAGRCLDIHALLRVISENIERRLGNAEILVRLPRGAAYGTRTDKRAAVPAATPRANRSFRVGASSPKDAQGVARSDCLEL